MTDAFEPAELAAADGLDRLIDDVLADRPSPGADLANAVVVAQLVAEFRDAVPSAVVDRVAGVVRRAEHQAALPVRLAALVLGVVFAMEGLGNLFNGHWLADNLDVQYDAHGLFEGGVVFLALAAVVLMATVRTRWLDLAALAGVPAGLVLAIHGTPEFGEFPEGGILHATQGAAAIAFGVLWWIWHRRYARRAPTEGEL